VDERQFDAAAPDIPLRDRQYQQRQPGQKYQYDNAAAQEKQRVIGQVGAPENLIQGPPRTSEKSVGSAWIGSLERLGVIMVKIPSNE
jgi:hypothetical protein